jgi:hypothetical protein
LGRRPREDWMEVEPADLDRSPIQQVQWHCELTGLLGTWSAPPRSRRYAPLSGAAKYPAGARPSKCIIIIIHLRAQAPEECLAAPDPPRMRGGDEAQLS